MNRTVARPSTPLDRGQAGLHNAGQARDGVRRYRVHTHSEK